MRVEVENPMVLGSWNNNRLVATDDDSSQPEAVVKCDVCGETWMAEEVGEGISKSELWEDVYVCDKETCTTKHYHE